MDAYAIPVPTNSLEILADPTRRAIVEALVARPRAVGEITELVGIQQSGVSRHLRILGEAGFVSLKKDGTRHIYELRTEPFRDLDDWLGRFRTMWEDRLDRFDKALAGLDKLDQLNDRLDNKNA